MDSITQVVLGAGVGEVVAGKKAGNHALLWGGILGTLPDLDVLIQPLYSFVDGLFVHRGFSHSIIFATLAAPLFGWALHKIYHKKTGLSFRRWSLFTFLVLFTHILLDTLTGYGTGLLTPLVQTRYEVNSIAIIDVFYTLPFLIALIWVAFLRRSNPKRHKIARNILIITTAYLGLTLMNKLYVNHTFQQQLKKQDYNITEFRTSPLPLTNFLWMGLAKTPEGYLRGYYSVLNPGADIHFEFLPRNADLAEEVEDIKKYQRLVSFTKGYYTLEQNDQGTLVLNDIRFGTLGMKKPDAYVFSFTIQKENGSLDIKQPDPDFDFTGEDFRHFLAQISGVRENQHP